MINIILSLVIFISGYIIVFYPEKVINLLSHSKKTTKPTPTKRIYKPRKPKEKSTIKTYRISNVKQSKAIRTSKVSNQKKETTFTSETKIESKQDTQIPDGKLDEIFENGVVYEDNPMSEEPIDCSTGHDREIDDKYGNSLFSNLIDAYHIAHGTNASKEEEEKACETIVNMYGTNVMDEMIKQSPKYYELAKRVITEKLNRGKEVKNNDFDMSQFYVKTQ